VVYIDTPDMYLGCTRYWNFVWFSSFSPGECLLTIPFHLIRRYNLCTWNSVVKDPKNR